MERKMSLNKISLIVIIAATTLALLAGCQESEKAVVTTAAQPKVVEASEAEQPEPEPKVQVIKTTPIIKVEKSVHDFGDIRPKSVHKCIFKFKNVGDGMLNISKIQSTCGCSKPKLKKKEYAPGESGEIEVTYTSSSKEGRVSKKLYIHSNDLKNKKAPLAVKSNVILAVKVNPKRLNLKLKTENQTVSPVTIESKDGKAFSIVSFTSPKNIITAKFDPNEKATEFTLQPEVNAELLKKSPRGNITIKITHPDTKQVNVSFEALPLFKVSHPSLVIKDAVADITIAREISVISNYGDPIEIESVSSTKGYVKEISREQDEKGTTLNLQITPPQKTKSKTRVFRDKLVIELKGDNKLTINCTGIYKSSS